MGDDGCIVRFTRHYPYEQRYNVYFWRGPSLLVRSTIQDLHFLLLDEPLQ